MNVANVAKAIAYSDRSLKAHGYTRRWLWDFWTEWTPEGQVAVEGSYEGGEPGDVQSDPLFLQMVLDCQRFVFGDEGDEAMGVPEQPATADEMDGKLGPMSIRRMRVWLDFAEEDIDDEVRRVPYPRPGTGDDCILVGGERIPVGGDVRIVSLDEDPSLDLSQDSRAYPWGSSKPTMLGFGHWDVCTSADKARRTLVGRRLSSGGGIDNPTPDGLATFYQWLDPGRHRGIHGGSKANRAAFFSWDLSNAVALKYQSAYVRKVGWERPVLFIDGKGQLGRGKGFLGMYAAQIKALLYILRALSDYTGLPLVFPVKASGFPVGRNWGALWKSGYRGVATHRHLPETTKWDVRGLEAQIIVLLLTGAIPREHFPSLVECFRLDDPHWHLWLDSFKASCRWTEIGL